jgi:hypothetical protein
MYVLLRVTPSLAAFFINLSANFSVFSNNFSINPHYFSLLRLVVDEGSELAEDIEKGKFQLLTPLQILDENIILLENIELTDCIFRANHVSNLVNLAGTLNQDRDMLINKLKRVRENPNFIPYTYNGL